MKYISFLEKNKISRVRIIYSSNEVCDTHDLSQVSQPIAVDALLYIPIVMVGGGLAQAYAVESTGKCKIKLSFEELYFWCFKLYFFPWSAVDFLLYTRTLFICSFIEVGALCIYCLMSLFVFSIVLFCHEV